MDGTGQWFHSNLNKRLRFVRLAWEMLKHASLDCCHSEWTIVRFAEWLASSKKAEKSPRCLHIQEMFREQTAVV